MYDACWTIAIRFVSLLPVLTCGVCFFPNLRNYFTPFFSVRSLALLIKYPFLRNHRFTKTPFQKVAKLFSGYFLYTFPQKNCRTKSIYPLAIPNSPLTVTANTHSHTYTHKTELFSESVQVHTIIRYESNTWKVIFGYLYATPRIRCLMWSTPQHPVCANGQCSRHTVSPFTIFWY